MKKNTANQYVMLQAWDTAAAPRSPKTGDAANISAFISLDGAAESAATNSPSELDAVNCPGVYLLELTAAECNADTLVVTATSTTANVEIDPICTYPTQWTFDTLTWDSIVEGMMAVLFGIAAKQTNGVIFRKRDGTTAKITIVHDSAGNRTSSTVS